MNDIPSPVPAPGPGVSAPRVRRAIYGIPMFATPLVADVEATTSWYVDGLGFSKPPVFLRLIRGACFVAHMEERLSRGRG